MARELHVGTAYPINKGITFKAATASPIDQLSKEIHQLVVILSISVGAGALCYLDPNRFSNFDIFNSLSQSGHYTYTSVASWKHVNF
jgi:hypothetical protein